MKIAIASGKGGTGKTTLAVNLASFLSRNYKTVLVDLDVEEPNSGLFIRGELVKEEDKFRMVPKWIPDKCTLCRECQNNCNFNAIVQTKTEILIFPQLCHGCYACSDLCPENTLPMVPYKTGQLRQYRYGDLTFVESRLLVGEEMAVPLIEQTVDYIDKNFDNQYVKIFDSPPGTSCPVIAATKSADYVILVTEPTPFGLHDLRLAVETMEKLGKKYGVVINRDGLGDNQVEQFCNERGIEILARFPNDKQVAHLYAAGELLYEKLDYFARQLAAIEQKLGLSTFKNQSVVK